ncbi:MAG TPA: L,D-transpeptidase/peptidoglycan binding protein [Solirubrobacteraceae bacterium]|nr:L,D-transpeptidase/peptidoglycan binding protein [Solirubrobacteraceae bacterium]
MRSRTFVVVTVVLVTLGMLAGAVYAFDHARRDEIAKGVTVGGVDVGGLTPAEARAKLQRQILDPLREPVVVTRGRRTWRLTAERARIAANLDASVSEALARSRDGGVLERAWRGITGGEVDARLDPEVTYSRKAVTRFVSSIEGDVDRPATDAKVNIDGSGITKVPSRTGVQLRRRALRAEIRAAITSPTATREFVAHAGRVKPKVTTGELAHKYGTVLIVNRGAFRLTLYKRLKVAKTYPIAVGQVGLETPAGLYSIANKAVNPAWHVPDSAWAGDLAGKVIAGDDPSNPIKARWLGIYDGVGIHGTSDDASIGSAASHGCIRMHIPDVEDLYDRVPVGTPVYIA